MENNNLEGLDPGERFSLLDKMPVGVCVLSADLTVLFWNDCLAFWTGIIPSRIIGRPVTDFVPALSDAHYLGRLDSIFHGGPPVLFSAQAQENIFPATSPSGERRVQQTTVVGVPSGSAEYRPGRPGFYALFTVEDVTELTHRIQEYRTMHRTALEEVARREALEEEKARMEERARHMQKLESIGVLASGISHDFNNLLAVIVGNADIIASDAHDADLVLRCTAEIQKASTRATDLVAQILSYSGGGVFQLSPIDLTELVCEMRYLLTAPISKRVDVQFNLENDLPDITGDNSQLQQLIINLLSNASEAIGDNEGVITVSTGVLEVDAVYLETLYFHDNLLPGSFVYLNVADSGPGLDTGTLDKIFDPFFTTKFAGRGLGLAAVLGIVRSHNGALAVDSAPGKGATFRILLPVARETQQAAHPMPRPEATSTPIRTGGVLIVDDEQMVLELGQHLLRKSGYSVYLAEDGIDALVTMTKFLDDIDIVLLDVMLPNMNGYDVATALRRVREDIPIVLCSGYSEEQARSRFIGIPVSGFLKKPFSGDELLRIIDDSLAAYRNAR